LKPTPLSTVVDLREWRINDEVPGNTITRPLRCGTEFKIAGKLRTDPKQWSNVAATFKRPPKTGYTKPFLHLAYRFAAADGEGVRLVFSWPLNHSRSNKGEIGFHEDAPPPRIPGTYELQLVVGIEPAEGPNWGGLPYEYHVIARTVVQVLPRP
jgi:hypothetical protein